MRSDRTPTTPAPVDWSGDWVVALPLKGLAHAKSRLLLPPDARAALALAMALDTAAAALECPVVRAVFVVCRDDAASAFEELGCRVLPDRGEGGLNEVLAGSWARARADFPTSAFASVVADLPGLRPQDLASVLGQAGRHARSFVADSVGTGTTLLAALPGTVYAPSYGTASALRHRLGGAIPLSLPPGSPVRRDIDTVTDLGGASAHWLGPRTARLLAGLLGGSPDARAAAAP